MRQNMGASVPDQALAVPAGPVARPGPSGFDPSRKRLGLILSRALGNNLRNEIARIVCDADMGVKRDGLLGRHYLAADHIFDAIAIEAAEPLRREAGSTRKGESAGLEEASPGHHRDTQTPAPKE